MTIEEIRKKIERARSFRIRVGFFDTRTNFVIDSCPRIFFSPYVKVSREFARSIARELELTGNAEIIKYCWELDNHGTLYIN